MRASGFTNRALALAIFVWSFGFGCDPPALPPAEPDLVLTNLSANEVKGLHQVLRAIKQDTTNSSTAVKEISPAGHLVRARFIMDGASNPCPAVNDAYNDTWVCYATVTGVFKLKNKFSDTTSVNGGDVVLENNASGDLIKLSQQVKYFWDSATHTLTISIRYAANPSLANHIRTWGSYTMKGTTKTSITTQSSSERVDFSFSSPFTLGLSGSVEKTKAAKTSLVRVLIAGNPFWSDRGVVAFKRDVGGESYFMLGMDWFTNALVNYTTTVIQHNAECNGSNKHSGSLNVKVESNNINSSTTMSVAVGVGSSSSASCKAWTDTLAGQLHFQAANALACGNQACAGEVVGERFRSYIRIRNLFNGNCRRNYDVGFTAAVNWNMSLTASNAQTGAGFDLGSGTSVWDQLSSAAYSNTFPCN